MDLKQYYKKLRELEAALPECVVLVSKETPEGGRAGRFTETPRTVAARLIAEGAAEQASETDTERFRQETEQQRSDEERRRAASRIQVSVITEDQARALTSKPAFKPKAEKG